MVEATTKAKTETTTEGKIKAKKINLIVFSGEMDKVLAALNIAIGGASMGMDVTMFFTFWGLNVIKKNEGSIKSKGIMRKMLNLMNRGGSKRLPLSKLNMLGLGPWMMGKMMKDVNFPSVEELMKMARDMGVKFITCTTTVGMMGITPEAIVPESNEWAGVSTFLANTDDGSVNLFI